MSLEHAESGEIDLLGHRGKDLIKKAYGGESKLKLRSKKDEEARVLVWDKLETSDSYQPSSRDGHTAVSCGTNVLVFGGFVTGKRQNSLISLDTISNHWSVVNTKGELPPPRNDHAAVIIDESDGGGIMLVHGGEGMTEDEYIEESEKEASIMMQNQSIDTINTFGKAKYVDGVCPEDTLMPFKTVTFQPLKVSLNGQVPKFKPNEINGSSTISAALKAPNTKKCLDDMYTYDIATKMWIKIPTVLAPLPRKGHTLNIVTVEGERQLLLFGGYSVEKATMSNSLHICPIDSILEYHNTQKAIYTNKVLQQQQQQQQEKEQEEKEQKEQEQQQQPEQQEQQPHGREEASRLPSAYVGKMKSIKGLKENYTRPVWRMLHCVGTPPCPRYRHTCSLLYNRYHEEHVVVMGGIGNPAKSAALCDVHILNLITCRWTELKGPDPDPRATAGPLSGIFGHVAFPIGKMSDKREDEWPVDLLIFGGSHNVASPTLGCYQQLYCFNMSTQAWVKVNTGYLYPSARVNHSVAVVSGVYRSNNLPNKLHSGYDPTLAQNAILAANKQKEKEKRDLLLNTQRGGGSQNGNRGGGSGSPKAGTRPRPSSAPVIQQFRNHKKAGPAKHVNNGARITFKAQGETPVELLPAPPNTCVAVLDKYGGETFTENHFTIADDACAIIFGGSSSIPQPPNTWALPLRWRAAGMEQYDSSFNSEAQRLVDEMEEGSGGPKKAFWGGISFGGKVQVNEKDGNGSVSPSKSKQEPKNFGFGFDKPPSEAQNETKRQHQNDLKYITNVMKTSLRDQKKTQVAHSIQKRLLKQKMRDQRDQDLNNQDQDLNNQEGVHSFTAADVDNEVDVRKVSEMSRADARLATALEKSMVEGVG